MHATAEVNRQAKDLLLDIHRGSLLAPYVELGLARTISVDDDHLQDKLTVNGRAMQLFPIDDVTYREAMLLGLHGDKAQAQRQWDLAAVSYPEDEERALRVVKRRVDDGLDELAPAAGVRAEQSRRAHRKKRNDCNRGVRTEEHLAVIIAAVASGALFIWPTIAKLFSRRQGGRRGGGGAADQPQGRGDRRRARAGEFKAGRIPNARNMPAGESQRTRAKGLGEAEEPSRSCWYVRPASARRRRAGSLQKQGFAEPWSRCPEGWRLAASRHAGGEGLQGRCRR